MRLIDADVLEELFRETISHIAKNPKMSGNLEHMVRASAMVIEMINDAPTIKPQKWIPVSERLPEKKSDVLVTIFDGFNPFVDTDLWDGSRFFCYGNHRVEAWMPLPEPWKGEEE